MAIKKSVHHEEHEDFSWHCMTLITHPQGDSHFWRKLLFFFVVFVYFVVEMLF